MSLRRRRARRSSLGVDIALTHDLCSMTQRSLPPCVPLRRSSVRCDGGGRSPPASSGCSTQASARRSSTGSRHRWDWISAQAHRNRRHFRASPERWQCATASEGVGCGRETNSYAPRSHEPDPSYGASPATLLARGLRTFRPADPRPRCRCGANCGPRVPGVLHTNHERHRSDRHRRSVHPPALRCFATKEVPAMKQPDATEAPRPGATGHRPSISTNWSTGPSRSVRARIC
jgi:hypothetical protein